MNLIHSGKQMLNIGMSGVMLRTDPAWFPAFCCIAVWSS